MIKCKKRKETDQSISVLFIFKKNRKNMRDPLVHIILLLLVTLSSISSSTTLSSNNTSTLMITTRTTGSTTNTSISPPPPLRRSSSVTSFPVRSSNTVVTSSSSSSPATVTPSSPSPPPAIPAAAAIVDPLPISLPVRQSTISIGSGRKGQNGTGGSGGGTTRTRGRPSLPAATPPPPPPIVVGERVDLHAGLILPYSVFQIRDYWRNVNQAMNQVRQRPEFGELNERHFSKKAEDHILIKMITFSPSPKDILSTLCNEFLDNNVSAIIYLTNTEMYGASTAASQYFLQLSGYLGLPVIAWNADNSGLRKRATSSSMEYNSEMVLQMAPSIHHQAAAMLSILTRYNWHQFAIVTSQIAGHDDFVQAVRDRVLESQFKFTILSTVQVLGEADLHSLVGSEARILLLYCTKDEAKWIMRAASSLGLTGSKYVWIVTQSVMGDKLSDIHYQDLPIGMLGVHFNTTMEALKYEITNAVKVFMSGVQAFRNDSRNNKISLKPNLSCYGSGEQAKWRDGDHFYRALASVEVPQDGRPPLSFNGDGTLSNVELKIMNLRPSSTMSERTLVWEQIGVWRSWRRGEEDTQLDIKDIVWPGKSHKPPDGVPEKFHLKITFLEEAPYIRMTYPDPVTGRCSPDRGVLCKISNNNHHSSNKDGNSDGLGGGEGISRGNNQKSSSSGQQTKRTKGGNKSGGGGRGSNRTTLPRMMEENVTTFFSNYQCCSGFNIDLLLKFAEDIGFTYELVRVADSKWGTHTDNKWNGLIGELTNRRVDVALASLMINSEREAVVDFSVPFMDSGIAIMTAKRTGIISPTAFLEPFDASLWFLVCVVGIQVYSLFIFFFEWLSPLGFDMKKYPTPGSRFSFFRSCWLVWARLFQASVHVDPPRGFTAKFVVHVWSMFAVVFLTANLAVFMITREESHQFSGIDDLRLTNPMSVKPPLKFGTVINTHTASLFKKHVANRWPDMWRHMDPYNVVNVSEGVNAVRRQELDAFIYDGPVLEYEVLQDTSDNCQLLMEGAWYAHTGYGIAFQRNSKYLSQFNKYLMEYKENGDLDRLRRFYFTGPCAAERSTMQTQPQSIGKFNTFGTGPLALEQFLSVFLLLGIGVLVATAFVFCERAYANCIVRRVFGEAYVGGGGGGGGGKEKRGKGKKKAKGKGGGSGSGMSGSLVGIDSAGASIEGKGKKPPPACLQLLSQNMGLPYSRTFYRAHKRDSKIKLLDHFTSSFNIYDSSGGHTISDYHHGFLESFVLRKMITCNDPICQRNFVKLENELKKCLVRLRQIENWGRMYGVEGGLVPGGGGVGGGRGGIGTGVGGGGVVRGFQPGASLIRTRISTIERNHDEIVGRRICGDYSDYSIFSGVIGGGPNSAGAVVPGGQQLQGGGSGEKDRRVFRDEVIGCNVTMYGGLGSLSGLSGSTQAICGGAPQLRKRSAGGMSEFGSRRELGDGGSCAGVKVRVSVSSDNTQGGDDEQDRVEGSDSKRMSGTDELLSGGGPAPAAQMNTIIKVSEIETVL